MDWLMGRTKKKDKDVSNPAALGSTKLYLDESFTKEAIHLDVPNVDLPTLTELVRLPESFEQDEWMAWHTIAFFEQLNVFIGVISHECTHSTCQVMTAPGNVTYSWLDEKGKKIKCPAPQYIDYVTTYIHKNITDSAIFPTRYGEEFPANFLAIVQKIHKFMFQVLAHIYNAHYHTIVVLKLNGHLNTFYTLFMLFTRTFKLIDEKDTDNMRDLSKALKAIPLDNKENHLE